MFRLVEGDRDERFDEAAVARAWQRAEHSKVDQQQIRIEGSLLGLIPLGRRFEFVPTIGEVIRGKVGTELSHNYIERIANEPFYGNKRWSALVDKKLVERPDGATSVSYTLLQLNEIEP